MAWFYPEPEKLVQIYIVHLCGLSSFEEVKFQSETSFELLEKPHPFDGASLFDICLFYQEIDMDMKTTM